MQFDFRKCVIGDFRAAKISLFNAVFNSNFKAVFWFRVNQWVHYKISKKLAFILHNRHRLRYGVDLYPGAIVAPGLVLAHLGGVVVGDRVIIEANVCLQSGVTLGQSGEGSGTPRIGHGVYVGTGAKVLGGITIGANSVVGAGAVVVKDVEEGVVVAGVPARVISRK